MAEGLLVRCRSRDNEYGGSETGLNEVVLQHWVSTGFGGLGDGTGSAEGSAGSAACSRGGGMGLLLESGHNRSEGGSARSALGLEAMMLGPEKATLGLPLDPEEVRRAWRR